MYLTGEGNKKSPAEYAKLWSTNTSQRRSRRRSPSDVRGKSGTSGFLHNVGEMPHFPIIFYGRMRPPLRQMMFNSRNHLVWQFENPHAIRESAFQIVNQYRWSINVWAGVLKDRVIGPHFLPRLSAQAYREFLENDLPMLLEDVPLNKEYEGICIAYE
ncbi:hypothetical protein G5I_13255 [Acromyrmex echinatior]|uniref:Uncharacterized protein n=1 Tax=Acromyrmex echinatior TaxID=103372 RepID=F4X4J2_ACREC|nr:hypothetical protein G5I_13255 [Acromyrmex echinatior]